MQLINIGFGNMVSSARLLAIVSPDSAPIKRMIQEAKDRGMLIDASFGRGPCDSIGYSAGDFDGPGQRADRGDERGGRTMSEGKLIILSGPSGAGKSTVIRQILERHPDFFFSVSATTRQPRGGERDGVHYHFITPAQFEGMIAGQALLEYNHYASGDYYGTPAEPVRRVLDRGGTVLLDVEPNGAFQVLEKLPQAVMVFLAPPSLAELRRRLESRGDTPPDKVEARLKQAHWELAQAPHYTYLVVNDQVDVCVAQVEAILQGGPEAAACRYENQSEVEILKEVLSHAVSPHV